MDIDINALREKEVLLLKIFSERNYSCRYISEYKSVFNKIFKLVKTGEYQTYEDVYTYYLAVRSGPSLRSAKNTLSSIRYFDTYGTYPEGKMKPQIGVGKSRYELLSDEFRGVIDTYQNIDSAKGKKSKTIKSESSSGTTFLTCIQDQGIFFLEGITQQSVIDVFLGDDKKMTKSCSVKKSIKAVFKACLGSGIADDRVVGRIISFLPKMKNSRKNIQYLTDTEYRKLRDGLLSYETGISLRDKSIGLLAMFTGLRSCDILNLTMDSIDWDNDVLSIEQQKTGVPLDLPLIPVVGNAIYEYITEKRPKTETCEIFISHNHPYSRLKSSTSYSISCSIMKQFGIRQEIKDRRGLHLLRHHLATELLSKDVPTPIISKILGHSSLNSTQAYLGADFTHLKECALSIEGFPVKVEALA